VPLEILRNDPQKSLTGKMKENGLAYESRKHQALPGSLCRKRVNEGSWLLSCLTRGPLWSELPDSVTITKLRAEEAPYTGIFYRTDRSPCYSKVEKKVSKIHLKKAS